MTSILGFDSALMALAIIYIQAIIQPVNPLHLFDPLMATLPIDIITNVLTRLPVKKLVSFKCVSKPWNSLIQDSDFVKRHLHHSFETNANVKLLLDSRTEDDEYKSYAVDFDSLGNMEELPRPYSDGRGFVSSRVFGSCNGLIAIWNDLSGIALWNPSTGACNYIPELGIGEPCEPGDLNDLISAFQKEFFNDDGLNELVIGFGYDIVGDDYKVVQMLSSGRRVMIYSLKSNSWKRVEDCPYQIPFNVMQDGVYSNGSLHWVGDEKDEPYGGRLMFGLDLGTDEFHRVPEPDIISDKNFGYRSVGVLGGSLCVFTEFVDEDHVILWSMKEYGVKESWNELVRLSRKEWWQPIVRYTKAITYSTKGDRVLLEDGGRPRQPAWFDLEKRRRETIKIPGCPRENFSATVYVESLVSVSAGSSLI